MDLLKSTVKDFTGAVTDAVKKVVGEKTERTDTEKVILDPTIKNVSDTETETPEKSFNQYEDNNYNYLNKPSHKKLNYVKPKQDGGMDDPNSEYWEAQYYKYKYLYLEATGR
jgi:hypothetical protein